MGLYVDEGLKGSTARNIALFGRVWSSENDYSANRLRSGLVPTLLYTAVLRISGAGLASLRMFNALVGAGTGLLIVLLAAEIGDWAIGVALATFAVHPMLILYSRLALYDTLMLAFALGGLVCASRSRPAALASGTLFGLALLTKSSALPLCCVGLALVLWRVTGPGNARKRALAACRFLLPVVPVICYLLWYGLGTSDRSIRSWVWNLGSILEPWAPIERRWAVALATLREGALSLDWALLSVALVGLVLGLMSRIRLARCLALWAFATLVPAIFVRGRYVPGRYLLPLYPILCVLAGTALQAAMTLRTRLARYGLGAICLALVLVQISYSSYSLLKWFEERKYEEAAVTTWLGRNLPGGSRVAGLWAATLCFDTPFYILPVNVNSRFDGNYSRLLGRTVRGGERAPDPTHIIAAHGPGGRRGLLLSLFPDAPLIRSFRVGQHELGLYVVPWRDSVAVETKR